MATTRHGNHPSKAGVRAADELQRPGDMPGATENDRTVAEGEVSQALAIGGEGGSGPMVLNDTAIADAIEASRAMEMTFEQFTKVETVHGWDQPFTIIDAVTITIPVTAPKPGEPTEKPVHVFQFAMEDGRTVFSMWGVNSIRDRIAQAFAANRVIGRRVEAGPLKIGQMPGKGWPQPAWVFEQQAGFKVRYP